jgi:hypothetical protein
MREAMAVTGYVPDEVARALASGKAAGGAVEVKPERGHDEVVARVDRSDIAEVRVGASVRGESLVQLILRKNATVETVLRAPANAKGVQRFHDPNLNRLVQAATAKNIIV